MYAAMQDCGAIVCVYQFGKLLYTLNKVTPRHLLDPFLSHTLRKSIGDSLGTVGAGYGVAGSF